MCQNLKLEISAQVLVNLLGTTFTLIWRTESFHLGREGEHWQDFLVKRHMTPMTHSTETGYLAVPFRALVDH